MGVGYPENMLVDGERIVVHSHPHWKCLVVPVVLFLVATAVAGLAAGATTRSSMDPTAQLAVGMVILAVWLAVTMWFFVRPLIGWRTTHFVLTDRRVTRRDGLLSRSGVDIPVQRISSVEFRHGVLDRMLRTGTLVIESVADDPLAFESVPHIRKVHALLHQEVGVR
ncbi:PH domain-containing protein [Williamsia sterculiae]|uniref:PH domain-containing protein n=1 Tax=Williamsia sterculiae TaxID=1344003 RepID=A0A1N7E006_9NOCA|nr:PH domain-containing protein [Williamsia sterculiae]SIR81376.1 PH domain-containing protein [Williamsia sterculiae]